MGNKQAKERREHENALDELDEQIYYTHQIYHVQTENCPFEFYLDNKLWDAEFNLYYKNIYETIQKVYHMDMPSQIINFIIDEFLKHDIYSHWYPRQYILNQLPKQQSLIPKRHKNSRKSISISNNKKNNIMNELIDKFDFEASLELLSKKGVKESWSNDFNSNSLFHEIVIYKKGDYFKRHIDTEYKEKKEIENVEITINTYDYTLVVIPPNCYKGGELIIYDKYDENDHYKNDDKNQIIFGSNINKWQWVLFPKRFEHESTKLVDGIKIAFKFHVATRDHGFGADLDVGDVCFEPMATGIPGMNRPVDAFGDELHQRQLAAQNEMVNVQAKLLNVRQDYGQVTRNHYK